MRFFKVFAEIVADAFRSAFTFIVNNLRNFAWILNAILPYVTYMIGQYAMLIRKDFTIGFELLIPFAVMILIYFLKRFADKLGKGTTIPIPEKRFTEIDEDGEVSIRNDRVQELILYLADLEDWMQRKGLL